MNETQIEHWNGPEARHWIDVQDRYDRQLAPSRPSCSARRRSAQLNASSTSAAGAAERRCSPPRAADAHRRRHLGADARPRTRTRVAAELSNVEFEQADAQTHPFERVVRRRDQPIRRDVLRRSQRRVHQHRPSAPPRAVDSRSSAGRNSVATTGSSCRASPPRTTSPSPTSALRADPGMFSLAEPDHVAYAARAGRIRRHRHHGVRGTDARRRWWHSTTRSSSCSTPASPARCSTTQTRPPPNTPPQRAQVLADHYDSDGVRLGAATWVVTAQRAQRQ